MSSILIQDEEDGSPGAILTKRRDPEEVTIQATNSYKDRASIAANANLLIANTTLEDEKTFTCMVVISGDIKEFTVSVKVQSEYGGYASPCAALLSFTPSFRERFGRVPDPLVKIRLWDSGRITFEA